VANKTQTTNLEAVRALLSVLDDYDSRGEKVEAASDIAWTATDQAISPEELMSEGPEAAVEYLRSLATISDQSKEIEELMPDAESQGEALARRWRSIRAKAIKQII
jgi:hypothetical protein